jgi:hypothetical protein
MAGEISYPERVLLEALFLLEALRAGVAGRVRGKAPEGIILQIYLWLLLAQ